MTGEGCWWGRWGRIRGFGGQNGGSEAGAGLGQAKKSLDLPKGFGAGGEGWAGALVRSRVRPGLVTDPEGVGGGWGSDGVRDGGRLRLVLKCRVRSLGTHAG